MSTRKTTIATPIRRSSAAKGRKGQIAHPAGFISVEIPVGDPHDLSYHGELRHHVDKDREDRDRQRQQFRRQILSIISWPKPGPASQHGETKHDCLGRKDADKYLEKARYRRRAEGRGCAEQDDNAEQRPWEVQLPCRLQQRENAE